jgi:signal transduction histidine kinase
MNVLAHRTLLADHDGSRRARVRHALLTELPGLEVQEAADREALVRWLEGERFDLTIVQHPLPSGEDLPVVLKARWPERVLVLYAPLDGEHTLAEALEVAGDAYFLESGTALHGFRAALRLALGRMRPGARSAEGERQRSGEGFAAIFKASPVGISLSTLADGTVVDVNDRFLEVLTDLRHAEAQRDQLVESERRARAEAESAVEQLRQGNEGLAALSRRLVERQEAERRALARELHDEVGQILAALKLHLEGAKVPVPTEVQSLLEELSSRVRNLSMDLRPPMLDELGLLPTLLWHFGRYHAETGVRVEFEPVGRVGRFDSRVETAAFRIVQEALTNVARHARVPEATVGLEAHPERIVLLVQDRGVGFRLETAWTGGSGGLAGMRERARLLGGRLHIESAPGSGTRLTAELPRTPVEGLGA